MERAHSRIPPREAGLKFLAIILICIVAAIGYGIIHDQITARICVEYFTTGHPPIFGTNDPTLLGFCWGVVATWWAGLLIGVPLAIAARFGNRPKREVFSLLRPIGFLLAAMAGCATVAGILGYVAASLHLVYLVGPMAYRVPADRHIPFLTDIWIHLASYGAGMLGGGVLCVKTWKSRAVTADTTQSAV
jgi:hypothetical protein